MTQLTIGHLAERAGVATSAIRFYESRGLITSVRTAGNQRRYEQSTLRRVAFIRTAQRVGLTLDEIGAALANLPGGRAPTKADWHRLSTAWRPRLDEQIERIERLRDRLDDCIGCGCLSLKSCALTNPDDEAAERGPGAAYLEPQSLEPHGGPSMSLLHEPHHDGSPAYVDTEAPAPGSTVTVRLRTHVDDPVEQVWVRTTYDAEPTYHPCTATSRDEHTVWWEGALPVHNPVTNYRFLLDAPTSQRWLSAVGVVEHDPPDAFDFRLSSHHAPPDWARDAVVYQVFPDRFARSAAADDREIPAWAVPAAWEDEVVFEGFDPRTPTQFYGGDLDGITEHLDHLADIGVSVVYTTPVFPGESNHRYNASTFEEVDPLLGGDAAYVRLATAVHERGWRILGDLTTNHTGDTHEWFVAARDVEGAPARSFYYFLPDGSYESWMGHGTLPKLNHDDPALRAAMVDGPDSVVARWLRPPYDLDGWRVDVANMTGRLGAIDVNHEVARLVRRTAEDERSDAFVIGEHNHDASTDVDGDGWHGTMNYSGFSWPIWSWLRDPASPARAFGRPVPVPRRPGAATVRSIREWQGRYGWRATTCSWNILGSHDSARIRTVTGDGAVHRVAAALQFTMPGVPMLFAGDEIGLEGVNGEDSRRPFPWADPAGWDDDTLATYAGLARLRHSTEALRRGGLRWAHVDDDAFVYVREHPTGSVLVVARRAAGPAITLDAGALGFADGSLLLSTGADGDLMETDGVVTLPGSDGPSFSLWTL